MSTITHLFVPQYAASSSLLSPARQRMLRMRLPTARFVFTVTRRFLLPAALSVVMMGLAKGTRMVDYAFNVGDRVWTDELSQCEPGLISVTGTVVERKSWDVFGGETNEEYRVRLDDGDIVWLLGEQIGLEG